MGTTQQRRHKEGEMSFNFLNAWGLCADYTTIKAIPSITHSDYTDEQKHRISDIRFKLLAVARITANSPSMVLSTCNTCSHWTK
jgi:chorismate synthase